ncbi:MAG: hypothetical protein ACJ786_42460, partial [Catenulispora sp.]
MDGLLRRFRRGAVRPAAAAVTVLVLVGAPAAADPRPGPGSGPVPDPHTGPTKARIGLSGAYGVAASGLTGKGAVIGIVDARHWAAERCRRPVGRGAGGGLGGGGSGGSRHGGRRSGS